MTGPAFDEDVPGAPKARRIPKSFGDVTGEYVALRSGAGMVSGVHDLVWVRGPDTVRFLDGLLSRAVARIESSSAGRSLLLSPQGKLRATTWLLRGSDEVGILVDAGIGPVVVEDLNRFKIRVDVAIEADPGEPVAIWGPGADAALAASGLAVPAAERWQRIEGVLVAKLPLVRSRLDRFVVCGADTASLIAADIRPVGSIASETVRIEAGEPVMGVDLDERTIPQEGLVVDGAVDFDKGCYLGQELVARIDSRGHVNRLLRGIVVADTVIPPVGAEVFDGDRAAGVVTSVGESLELRAPIALALVRTEIVPGTRTELRWEGGRARAEVRELPLDPRLGDR